MISGGDALRWPLEGCMKLSKSLDLLESTSFRYLTHIRESYRELLILTLSKMSQCEIFGVMRILWQYLQTAKYSLSGAL